MKTIIKISAFILILAAFACNNNKEENKNKINSSDSLLVYQISSDTIISQIIDNEDKINKDTSMCINAYTTVLLSLPNENDNFYKGYIVRSRCLRKDKVLFFKYYLDKKNKVLVSEEEYGEFISVNKWLKSL